MHAGLLDVLHDAADVDVLAVADGVDVHLDREVEEAVEQHRAVVRHLHRRGHVRAQVVLAVARSPWRGRRARTTAAPPAGSRSGRRAAPPASSVRAVRFGGWRSPSRSTSCWKRSRSSATSIESGLVPMIGTPARAERLGELERRLPAVLHDHAERLLDVQDLHHVLERQRLEVQAVRSVVVGRDGLRVAVDHDGLEPVLAQRERRVHAAVVELDALADAIRAAAEDHDLAAVASAPPRTPPRRSSTGRRSRWRTRRRRCRPA